MSVGYTLTELAARCGGEVRGDGGVHVHAVATLQNAAPSTISFLANPHYRRYLPDTRAAAVILAAADAAACPVAALVTPDPYLVYARVATLLAPASQSRRGIDPAAQVSPEARVSPEAWVGPGAVVEAKAVIAARAAIGPNCVVMAGAEVGESSRLTANVTLCAGVSVGRRALIHPGVVIGAA